MPQSIENKRSVVKATHEDQLGMDVIKALPYLLPGIFGAVVILIVLLTLLDENPLLALLGGVVLVVASALFYSWRSKQQKGKDSPAYLDSRQPAAKVQRLEERMENLETLICRLDQELNRQMEESMIRSRDPSAVSTQDSRIATSVLHVSSALEARFQILGELGRGGMGVVIHAYDKQLKEQVAIKVLSPLWSRDQEAVERLRREVSAARRIAHPNVIRIYDISEANGLPYVSMEYFEGENLRDYIRGRGRLSIDLACQIALQICDGLEAAHRQGVVHRDLKSQNVILNHANQAKIIDFGLARSERAEGMTVTGLILGTPEYMSPEQVSGTHVDERADIYSFGIILYELLTGRVPFTGESAISIGFQQMKDDPPSPRSINPEIPMEMECLIVKALQKSPSQRFQSCAELRPDLERILRLPFSGTPTEESERPTQEKPVGDLSPNKEHELRG
jgi:serine/threonine protein kinase